MKLQVQGREVYAYTGGKAFDPTLPCVVFIHGAMNDHGNFTLLARWFAHHGFAVLAPDLPGHMQSAGPALTSVEAMADWLLALLDAAGVQRAALAGHSMGSLVALEAAARAPERATRLVMLGTAVPMPVPAALLELGATRPTGRDRSRDRLLVLDAGRQALVPGPGRLAARQRPGADAPGAGAQRRPAAVLQRLRRLQQLRQWPGRRGEGAMPQPPGAGRSSTR